MLARFRSVWTGIALACVLALAFYLRVFDLNWDENHHIHPDERWITMVAMDTTMPAQLTDALDPRRSPLNPYWNLRDNQPRRFAYGSFPLYLVRLVATGVSAVASSDPAGSDSALRAWRDANDYDHINLVGRALSAVFDSVTVLLAFLLGRRMFGTGAGLLAALLTALTVQLIQLAHFYAFDTVTTTVVVAAIYFGVCVAQGPSSGSNPSRRGPSADPSTGSGRNSGRDITAGSARDSIWLGAMIALAVASKFSALPLLLVAVLAHAVGPLSGVAWHRRSGATLGAVANPPLTLAPGAALEMSRAFSRLLLCLLTALVVFALASPFTFLDFAGYSASIGEQGDMVRGIADFPYTRQYLNTGLMYWLENWVVWAAGPALGIAALVGLGAVVWQAARRRISPAALVVLAWVVPYAAVTLSFQVKFLRYLAPVTPLLVVFAAGALWRLAVPAFAGPESPLRRAARLLPLAIVAGGTVLYALAFLQIYDGPLTRVQASEWMYRNVPAGAAITDESWDDSLPFARVVDGKNRTQGEYRVVTMNLHEPDDDRKVQNLHGWLSSADYVVISSNRMYGWLPRVAERFPITKRYYELLFGGRLGFVQAAVFTDYPRLGSLVLNDDRADESFTVYDHPKVLIFRKEKALTEAEFRGLFADLPPARQPAPRASPAPAPAERDRTLLLDGPVDRLPEINDRAWNPVANGSQAFAVVWWWVVAQLLGFAALPATLRIFRRFRDGGYAFAKSLGLLAVAWLLWIGGSLRLIMNHALTAWTITGLLLVLAALALWRDRERVGAFLRERRPILLFEEALFAAAYLAFVGIRLLNPDLWQPWNGGEKFMEFAFLNAILKSPYFPPYDPYFAGGYINYYYYGIYLVGVLVKLTGIASEVAFNLAIPTLFALTVTNAFAVAFNIASPPGETSIRRRAIASGLCAALFVAVIGNLDGIVQIVEGLGKAAGSEFKSGIIGLDGLVGALEGAAAVLFGGRSIPAFDYWRSSRVIPNTINEFPYWSFLFSDLHPHMIGIPFTLLAIGLAAHAFVREAPKRATPGTELDSPAELATPLAADSLHLRGIGLYVPESAPSRRIPWADTGLYGGALALTLGAIAAINTWDAPTYLGLALGTLILRWIRNRDGSWLPMLAGALAIGVASIALYAPFFANYKALYVGLGVTDIHTEFQPFVVMWGFLLFVAGSYLVVSLRDRGFGRSGLRAAELVLDNLMRVPRLVEIGEAIGTGGLSLRAALALVSGVVLIGIALAAAGLPVMALLLWCLAGSTLLLLRMNAPPGEQFLAWLAFWAFGILLGVEVVYLQDFLGGEWKRMNTLFKFYIQAWVLLGVLGGVALPLIWERIARRAAVASHTESAAVPGTRSVRVAGATRRAVPALWQTAFMLLLGSVLIFPIAGTLGRVGDRFPNARPPIGTLDGMEYMRVGVYAYPDDKSRIEMRYDLDAIRWLQENVRGTPVLAEAAVGYYREAGVRVSSYTGLPTLLGMHQSEQRYADDVGKRDGEAREFFNTADSARAMELVRLHRIRYIYIGPLERLTYAPAGIDKFDLLLRAGVLDVAYRNPQVIIYRVRG